MVVTRTQRALIYIEFFFVGPFVELCRAAGQGQRKEKLLVAFSTFHAAFPEIAPRSSVLQATGYVTNAGGKG